MSSSGLSKRETGLIVSFVAVLLLVLVLVGNTVTGPSSASALRKKKATPVSDFMNKLPTEWSEVDVGSFLESLDLSGAAKNAVTNRVDGKTLAGLEQMELTAGFGMRLLQAKRVQTEINYIRRRLSDSRTPAPVVHPLRTPSSLTPTFHEDGIWRETLSDYPKGRVYVYHNFLSADECDHMIDLAKPELAAAEVVGGVNAPPVTSRSRTNLQKFLTKAQTPMVKTIEDRIALVTGTKEEQGEAIQVLRYQRDQQFTVHTDYFAPGVTQHLARGGQRIATMIMYLKPNPPNTGGATYFPKMELRVHPERGAAILFYDVTPTGENDVYSYHGGEPITADVEKWVATRWIRQHKFV